MIETNERCIICGTRENITLHSVIGKHLPPYVPICKEHHIDIENIKLAIRIMKREKKISIKRFRRIIDTFDNLEKLKEEKNVSDISS
jgi:hypothetical protein